MSPNGTTGFELYSGVNNDVGGKIRKIRRDKELSQEWLAEKIGVTAAYISKIENGHSDPDTELLKQLAEALGVHITDFFSERAAIVREEPRIYFSMPGHISEAERRRYQELMRRLEEVRPGDVETVLKLLDAVFPKKSEDEGDEKRNRPH